MPDQCRAAGAGGDVFEPRKPVGHQTPWCMLYT